MDRRTLTTAMAMTCLLGAQSSDANVVNGSFETPDKGTNGWNYESGLVSSWTFNATGGTGLSGPNGPWKASNTSPDPGGDQFAFLQGGTAVGPRSISQTLTGLTVGTTYNVDFFEAYRVGTLPGNDMTVILDKGLGTELTLYNNAAVGNNNWEKRQATSFTATKSYYTLSFQTTNPLASGDRSTVIDGVTVYDSNIIYQHSFSGANNVNLLGTAPDISNNPDLTLWSGSTPAFDADGSVDAGEGNRGAWLPFEPQAGKVYQLSGSIDYTGPGDWITLGWAEGNPNANFNTTAANAYGTVLVTGANGQRFDGVILGGGVGGLTMSTGVNEIDIILDASDANAANWTMQYSINGSSVGGPNTAAAGSYANINYVGFSTQNAGGVIDDFSLTIIPEPSSLGLLGIGGLLVARRRR